MKVLLDTHAFIWFVEDNAQLPLKSKQIIEKQDNEVFLSIASVWEMAIKIQLGKLNINKSIEEIVELIAINGFQFLPILPNHIIRMSTLNFFHRDPFDRIIIAQGLTESATILSRDAVFDNYEVKRVWE
jgi:PIN domain nuclease of toxin-antitoxin system